MESLELDLKERLLFENHFMLLAAHYPHDKRRYLRLAEIARNGYESHYSELFEFIDPEPTSADVEKETNEVFQMFDEIELSIASLPDKSRINEIKFGGFDGESESQHLGIGRFLLNGTGRHQNKYRRFLDYVDSMDSHWPKMAQYRPMMIAWKKFEGQFPLPEDAIMKIIEARKP
jgi:uncharacterized protein YfbU (UPF0304 family)